MRKSKSIACTCVAAATLASRSLFAGVNPVVVQSWETGANTPTGTDVGWYGNVPNAGFNADGTATNNVGWEIPGGGVSSNPADSLSVSVGSVATPAAGATDGVNSLQVTAPGGFDRGAQFLVNSSFQAFKQGMNSSNLIEFDITLTTPLTAAQNFLGINFSMAFKGTDASDSFIDGFNDSDNQSLSDPGFGNGPTGVGTHTSIWNYGAIIQDFYETGLENTDQRFFARLDLSTNSGSADPVTFNIDNIRFVSRAITWTGGANGTLSNSGNWNGVTSRDDSHELENLQGDSATNHPELNDALHFAGTTNTTVTNDMGTFAAAGGYAENSQFGGLVFDAGAGAFTINGNAIDLAGDGITDPTASGDIINNSTSVQTINVPIRLLNNITVKANSGTLVFAQPITQILNNGSAGIAFNAFGITFAGPGATTLSAANTWTSFTNVFSTLTIAATGSIATTSNLVGAGGTMNVIGSIPTNSIMTVNGNLNFTNPGAGINVRSVNTITLSSTGKVTLTSPGPGNHANRTVLVTPNLTLGGGPTAWAGVVDLTANDLIVQGGGAAALTNTASQLKQGFNAHAGYWNGPAGIESSAAAGDTRFLTTLGYRSGGSAFDGVNTTSSDVLVKYTYYGDADLNGAVNGADYHQIDLGFGSQTTPSPLSGWSNGDFNYDGRIDGSDYALIDNTFNQLAATGASALAILADSPNLAASPTAVSAVPEPTALALFGIGISGFLARPRRRRNRTVR